MVMVAESQTGNPVCSPLQHLQFSTMAAVDDAPKRSIKFKITSKELRLGSEDKSCENMTMIGNNESRDGVTANGKSIKVNFSTSGNSSKRKHGMILECQREKKARMDRSFKQQCRSILRSLMEHPHGIAFNQPVDPVKLKVPDYFSIVTKPMDLGTIKQKLERDTYFNAEEFASDVRLTFSNAMLYNPPGNYVHNFAKELNGVFNRRWKLMETKLKCTGKTLEQLCNLDEIVKNGCTLVKIVHKDDGNLSAYAAANRKQPFDSPAVKCATCGGLMCQCSLRRCSIKPSSSERSSDRDRCADSKSDYAIKYPMMSHTRELKLDSDGHTSVSNEDNLQQSVSSPPTTAAIDEGWTSLGNMSPNKALRAAMLKSRFADTIFRAKHQSLLDHDKKINPVNQEKERERLERLQHADKARIAAEFKAAEAASRMKAEAELKMQREREREAARIAVEKMVKTVDIEENRDIMEDLEAIMGAINNGNLRNPLEQLGLYIKDDYMEDDEDAILRGEEGEILS
ncbi:transcription factor GTE12 [Olea europaea subsp. europaea]|uniref:Transcription factor GTE12 n=1 Tax=Olea europaea subsp. europaea TaxID=158383 RepID=A0A8S0TMG5_OLEEU|nr:transcription factor GTE12 [Olea europaea subsp. europaea]